MVNGLLLEQWIWLRDRERSDWLILRESIAFRVMPRLDPGIRDDEQENLPTFHKSVFAGQLHGLPCEARQ